MCINAGLNVDKLNYKDAYIFYIGSVISSENFLKKTTIIKHPYLPFLFNYGLFEVYFFDEVVCWFFLKVFDICRQCMSK